MYFAYVIGASWWHGVLLVAVFGGEVDCCQERDGKTAYVELKTSRAMYHANQERNFKK